jgi:hypothetical protein
LRWVVDETPNIYSLFKSVIDPPSGCDWREVETAKLEESQLNATSVSSKEQPKPNQQRKGD